MKRIVLLAVIAFLAHGILKAQNGAILTKDTSSQNYFLENITKDSLTIVVINEQKKKEVLPNGAIAITDTPHKNVEFVLPPGKKRSLKGLVCIHTTGFMISSADKSSFIKQTFYTVSK
jgi:hypothetical protein